MLLHNDMIVEKVLIMKCLVSRRERLRFTCLVGFGPKNEFNLQNWQFSSSIFWLSYSSNLFPLEICCFRLNFKRKKNMNPDVTYEVRAEFNCRKLWLKLAASVFLRFWIRYEVETLTTRCPWYKLKLNGNVIFIIADIIKNQFLVKYTLVFWPTCWCHQLSSFVKGHR